MVSDPSTRSSVRTVTVTGSATIEVRPDSAELDLGVRARGRTASDAMTTAARRTSSMLNELQGMGVNDEEIRTVGLNLWHDDVERRYVVTNAIRVRVAAHRVGEHIDMAARAAGDTFVLSGVRFAVTDDREHASALREHALADARGKAAELAAVEGADLGDVIAIVEGGPADAVPLGRASLAKAEATPVEPGVESLSRQITVTYELR